MNFRDDKVILSSPSSQRPKGSYEKIKEGFESSFKKIQSARGKDLVLVVGMTGAGKSTIVNYMLGYRLKKSRGKAVSADSSQGMPPAEMSDRAESVTTYPAAYDEKDGFTYCDCPGFEDNRDRETRVCISLSTEATVKIAKSIRAMMVIVDWGSIVSERGKGLKDLALTLGNLLNSQDNTEIKEGISKKSSFDISKSLLFVVNKIHLDDGIDVEECLKRVDDLLETLTKKLDEAKYEQQSSSSFDSALNPLEENNLDERINSLKKQISILSLMRLNKDNIILADLFDTGETRKQITQRLQSLQSEPIPVTQFNFNETDNYRKLFCALTTGTMVEPVSSMRKIQELSKEIRKDEKEKVSAGTAKKVSMEVKSKSTKMPEDVNNTSIRQLQQLKEFLTNIKDMVEEQAKLHLPKTLEEVQKRNIIRPQIFISYTLEHDTLSSNLQTLLKQIATHLAQAGLSPLPNIQQSTGNSDERMRFDIRNSQYVLLIGTKHYTEKTKSSSNANVRKELDFALRKSKENRDFPLSLMLEGDSSTTFPEIKKELIRDCRSWYSLEQGEWQSLESYFKELTQLEPFGILPTLLGLNRRDGYSKFRQACLKKYREYQQGFMAELKLMNYEFFEKEKTQSPSTDRFSLSSSGSSFFFSSSGTSGSSASNNLKVQDNDSSGRNHRFGFSWE